MSSVRASKLWGRARCPLKVDPIFSPVKNHRSKQRDIYVNPKHPPFLCKGATELKICNPKIAYRLNWLNQKKQRHPKTTKEGTLDLLPPPRIPVITKDSCIFWYVGNPSLETFICHPYWLGGYIQAVIVSKKKPSKNPQETCARVASPCPKSVTEAS